MRKKLGYWRNPYGLLTLALIFAGLFLALRGPAGLVAGLCLFWGLAVLRLLYTNREEQRKTNRVLGELEEDLLGLFEQIRFEARGMDLPYQPRQSPNVQAIKDLLAQKSVLLEDEARR